VEIWERELGVHAKGVFLGTRTAIPAIRKGGGGSIINTSSVMGIVGSPTSPAYSAAKGAIAIFTKSAALQYARENIRINSVHPGYADTPLTEQRFSDPAVHQVLLDRTPMGRLGTAQDIANGVLFLASDESSWVTGSELAIDGRRSNRISVHGPAARRSGRPAGGRGHASRMARQGRGAKILRATALAGPGS
jgi:NAD(P)-dependent dehydrogenase (short-subunit alcohol dehydrogenase family)